MSDQKNFVLDTVTERAARLFVERISGMYPVSKSLVFGSRARGDFSADSDADIAVVLRGSPSAFLDTKLDMADIAYDVLLGTGTRIQPMPIWECQWLDPDSYSNPSLLRNIAREGIPL